MSKKYNISVLHSLFYAELNDFNDEGFLNSGIYKLKWYESDLKTPKSVNRLFGNDNTGVLYIGKSENLKSRLGVLVNLINFTSKSGKHSMGRRFQATKILSENINPKHLKFEISPCLNPRIEESIQLKKYVDEFGELPPLNFSS